MYSTGIEGSVGDLKNVPGVVFVFSKGFSHSPLKYRALVRIRIAFTTSSEI